MRRRSVVTFLRSGNIVQRASRAGYVVRGLAGSYTRFLRVRALWRMAEHRICIMSWFGCGRAIAGLDQVPGICGAPERGDGSGGRVGRPLRRGCA